MISGSVGTSFTHTFLRLKNIDYNRFLAVFEH
jgi:hypothetical protein